MTGRVGSTVLIRLAAIPQPLAVAFPFRTVHQAAAKTAPRSAKAAMTARREETEKRVADGLSTRWSEELSGSTQMR